MKGRWDYGWLNTKQPSASATTGIRAGGVSVPARDERRLCGTGAGFPGASAQRHGDHHLCSRRQAGAQRQPGDRVGHSARDGQRMTAGRGIRQANQPLEDGPFTLSDMDLAGEQGLEPSYDRSASDRGKTREAAADDLRMPAPDRSRSTRRAALRTLLKRGSNWLTTFGKNRHGWLQVARGVSR